MIPVMKQQGKTSTLESGVTCDLVANESVFSLLCCGCHTAENVMELQRKIWGNNDK